MKNDLYKVNCNSIGSTSVIIFIGLLWLCIQNVKASMCPGCVELDELSFNRTIKRFPYTLVKFDTAYPYGEKHEIYTEFSKIVHAVTDDLLIATVGIKDYGNYENQALSKRYNIDNNDKYPAFILYRNFNIDDFIQIPDTMLITLDNLKQFITTNTNIYIGCDGCLQQFNELVKDFAILSAAEQDERLQQASILIENLTKDDEKRNARIYQMYMMKIQQTNDDYVMAEIQRLQRLMASKISESKKSELSRRMNILEAFRVHKITEKDEF